MTAHIPLRRVGDLEIPPAGIWPAVGVSTVVRSTGRRSIQALAVLAGWFEIGEDPAGSALRIDIDDSALIATTTQISLDRQRRSNWQFEGFAENGERREPLVLSLTYHGVFRRGVDAWTWMSGTGAIGPPADRSGVRLAVELLFARCGEPGKIVVRG